MPQIGSVINPNNYSMFLENPSELPELDKWVEECITSQKRFTFSEKDVLQSLWDGGEDIRLREDSRFCEVTLPNQTQEVQWKLNIQIITNQRLYELLEDEEWDGSDLHQYLEQLDQNISEGAFHIFCVHDHRFILSYNDQGLYYAVLPVSSQAKGSTLSLPNISYESSAIQEIVQAVDEAGRHQNQLTMESGVKWKMTLRTVHINEGYIPIPTKARVSYPRAKKLFNIVAVAGVWFSDASEITVWLDTEKHQLYGPDVQDQLAFLVAGTMLEILWTASGITFNTIGVDTAIAEEEVRLVDLTELAHLRSATLESYRGSLRAIMAPSNIGWSFPELYSALCYRQQHKPNRSTIRAILSSSPEFIFVRVQNKWMLNYDITPETGARALRKATLIAQDISVGDDKTPSITEMITKSRHRLAHLRSMYISDTRSEL